MAANTLTGNDASEPHKMPSDTSIIDQDIPEEHRGGSHLTYTPAEEESMAQSFQVVQGDLFTAAILQEFDPNFKASVSKSCKFCKSRR